MGTSKKTEVFRCYLYLIFLWIYDLFLHFFALNLFGNVHFGTGYLEMRCSKSYYMCDFERLLDDEVIEQAYSFYD